MENLDQTPQLYIDSFSLLAIMWEIVRPAVEL